MQDTRYFSNAWQLLTRDKGWHKPLLVMTAASLVPVAGPLGNKGYALEWGRLTAWGVDAAPKQKNVDVGACIGSGWRGFVVDLGWGCALLFVGIMVSVLASVMPGALGAILGSILSLAYSLLAAAWGVVMLIAELRTSIYQRIGAGYRVNQVFEMVKRDWGGFWRLFLVCLACSAVLSVVGGIFVILVLLMIMPAIAAASMYGTSEMVIAAVAGTIVWVALLSVVAYFVLTFLGTAVRLITVNATALWMRQFDVPSWGRSEDPLPGTAQAQKPYYAPPAPGVGNEPVSDEPQPPAGADTVNDAMPAPVPEVRPEPEVVATPEADAAPGAEPVVGEEPAAAEPEPAAAEPEVEAETPVEPEPVPEVVPVAESEAETESANDTLVVEQDLADTQSLDSVDEAYESLQATIRLSDRVPEDDEE